MSEKWLLTVVVVMACLIAGKCAGLVPDLTTEPAAKLACHKRCASSDMCQSQAAACYAGCASLFTRTSTGGCR